MSSREIAINTEHAVLERGETPETVAQQVPRLADGIELIGEYQGSGFQEPRYILRRADGQVIQLPRLLYLLATAVDGQRDLQQVATALSNEYGRLVAPEQVTLLLDTRFRPAGIMAPDPATAGITTEPPLITRPDAVLALRDRAGVVPEHVVWRIAGIFRPMFWPPVILAALAAFIALAVVIVARGGMSQIVPSALALVHEPALTLLVLAMVLASAAFHECGHVTACRYGGARPGKMGVGLYLVWPALYSTVTDSYRLSRAGRLRTDLGGVYFNAIFIAGLSLGYLNTGSPWVLTAIVALHWETAMQFLPMVRLDGYYVLSDIIGVPDLFSWIGPVLKSLIPGRASHSRVRELKTWVRATITLWVIIVVPFLLYWVIGFALILPRIAPVVWSSLLEMVHGVQAAAAAGHVAETALGVINILLLLFPWIGGLLLLDMIFRGPVLAAWSRWHPGRQRVERERPEGERPERDHPSPSPGRHRLSAQGGVPGRHRRTSDVKTSPSC